jgi:CPA1 family monovalent cation:H+ antiporter
MHPVQLIALVVVSLGITALARRRNWSAPLLLVGIGMAVSLIPGVPRFELHPDLLLSVVLPPLLYSASLDSSYVGFRASIRPIVGLGVGLVVATAFTVGLVAHLLLPSLPFGAALVLGAVVAPPDAVTAAAVGRKLGLPRRMMTVLSGESLVNDAAALTVYKVAVAAIVTSSGTFVQGLGVFAKATVVGVLIGLAIGAAVHAVRMRLKDPTLESVLGLVVPFAAYLLAEELGGSGVLAVVAAGLYIGHNSPRASFAMRLQEQSVWSSMDVLLEAFVFALIGLQTRWVLASLPITGELVLTAAAVLVTAIAVRVFWVFAIGYVRPLSVLLPPSYRRRRSWRELTVIGWTGMRGVVTLAAAAGIPELTDAGNPFPGRDAIQLFAFVVTVGTLLLQGLTLPWVIRELDVRDPAEQEEDARSEAAARQAATAAAVRRLEEVLPAATASLRPEVAEQVRQRLIGMVEFRGRTISAHLTGDSSPKFAGMHQAITSTRHELLGAQREALVAERDAGRLDDEVMRIVLRELDLEEAALTSSWRSRL